MQHLTLYAFSPDAKILQNPVNLAHLDASKDIELVPQL